MLEPIYGYFPNVRFQLFVLTSGPHINRAANLSYQILKTILPASRCVDSIRSIQGQKQCKQVAVCSGEMSDTSLYIHLILFSAWSDVLTMQIAIRASPLLGFVCSDPPLFAQLFNLANASTRHWRRVARVVQVVWLSLTRPTSDNRSLP